MNGGAWRKKSRTTLDSLSVREQVLQTSVSLESEALTMKVVVFSVLFLCLPEILVVLSLVVVTTVSLMLEDQCSFGRSVAKLRFHLPSLCCWSAVLLFCVYLFFRICASVQRVADQLIQFGLNTIQLSCISTLFFTGMVLRWLPLILRLYRHLLFSRIWTNQANTKRMMPT